MTNIVEIKSVRINDALIKMLEELLVMAKEGELRCLIGTGFTGSEKVISVKALDGTENMFKLLGAAANLQRLINDEID